MAGKVRHFDFHFSEWLAGTRGIGIDATGVYITVVAIAGDRGGLCPNDAAFIASQMAEPGSKRQALAGATKRTRHALVSLVEMGKLDISADQQWLTNGRADIELNKARERIHGATRAGIASGKARRRRAKGAERSMPTQRPLNAHSTAPQSNNSNDLDRTPVRNLQPYEYTHGQSLTDAAREPAPDQTAPARAHALPELEPERVARPESPEAKAQRELLAEITAAKRAAFLKGSS